MGAPAWGFGGMLRSLLTTSPASCCRGAPEFVEVGVVVCKTAHASQAPRRGPRDKRMAASPVFSMPAMRWKALECFADFSMLPRTTRATKVRK